MSIVPGEQADLLRAIGRLLDREQAQDMRLVNNGSFLTVSWSSQVRDGERHYEDHDLDELRRLARDARSDVHRGPRGYFADLLRTLGQDLDRELVDFSQILQAGDGVTVTGVVGRRYERRTFSATELLACSQRRRTARSGTLVVEAETVRPELPRIDFRPPVDRRFGVLGLPQLMEQSDGPLLRRMRQAQQRPA